MSTLSERLEAMVAELEDINGNPEEDIPSAWGRGYGAAYREITGDLRALLDEKDVTA